MSTFTPSPEFDYYYKACRKGGPEAKAVAVGYSAVRVLADVKRAERHQRQELAPTQGLLQERPGVRYLVRSDLNRSVSGHMPGSREST